MDDIETVVKSVRDYAIENESSQFDKVLPQQPSQLPTQSKIITYQTPAGTTQIISLNKENKYHKIIFSACKAGFKSNWFIGLSSRSKYTYFNAIRKYFDWINDSNHYINNKSRYDTLKEFEAYRHNVRGLKSSLLGLINQVIQEGMTSSDTTDSDYNFLQTLISLSKPAHPPKPEPVTLSGWFELPWLRPIISEQAYFQLESPRLLFLSFRATIATTLLYLLKHRQRWQQSSVIEFDQSRRNWQYDWNRILFEREGKFNKKGDPEDEFSQMLWSDLISRTGQKILKAKIMQERLHKLKPTYSYQGKRICPWQKPTFFRPDYQTRYSHIEELLCAWLAACEAIQPADIPKLKTKNYAHERNTSGRLIAMECTYYKGRSGTNKQPAILMGSDPWTRALDQYMTGLSVPHLFTTGVAEHKIFPALKRQNPITFLFNIWKLPSFQQQLESELKRTGATPLFLHAMLALEHGDENYSQFYKRTGKEVDEYRAIKSRPLPAFMFSFTHIKNTAVHAGTDSYRAADLVNHHSHSSLTEKTSYLTDKNKEWVNQAGRITRLVLHDLQNVVFQPSITDISQSVKDLELRTRISEATHTNDIIIHSMQNSAIASESDNTIVVSDTNDTALYFIHYINQAEALLPKLLSARPAWVERTLVVKVEWMTRTLTRMRTAATAHKTYDKLAAHLPPLFDHLLETTE